jgi:PAS domain S-box-containing protein
LKEGKIIETLTTGPKMKRHAFIWVLGLVLLVGLYLMTLYNYLLFHSFAEMFSIVVACAIFMLAWNTRRFLDNAYVLFLGIAYLFIAGLDLLHTLSYKGMAIFEGFDTNLPTQLWIAARYMESVSFLLAPFFLGRRVNFNAVLTIFALVTAFVLLSIFSWGIFPTCFIEGQGLTTFKVISEYVIALILMISLVIMFRRRGHFDPHVLRLIMVSISLTIISEMSFTFYVHAYGISNLIGHYLKIVSCYLIYKAIIETGLTRPSDLLFRSLKRSEMALRKERDFIATVLSTAGALVVVVDRKGHIVRFNKACEKLTGYAFEELRGKHVWDMLVIPEEAESAKAGFMRLQSGEFPMDQENYWVTKDGRRRLIMWSSTVLLDQDGAVEFVIATGNDMTNRKRIEENLVKLSRAVEQSPASVVITDVGGDIEYVNPQFVRLTGYRAEEVLGRNPRILKSGKHSPTFYQKLWGTIVSGKEWRGEFYNVKKTGEFYWEAASISPIKNDEGVITHFVAVKEDITERKAAEEALRNVRDDLDRRVKERTAELASKNEELEREIDERKRAQEALESSETELRHLSAKLLDAQEEESKRIGQELHDGLSQTLSAIKLWVEAAQIQLKQENMVETAKALESVIPLVQTSIEEIRRVSRHLRPSVLDDLGLLPAISWLCSDFEAINTGIRIERTVDIEEVDIPETLKIVIFRILQEALNNIAKHSHADLIRIALEKDLSGIVLKVEDNGLGFDMKAMHGVGNKMSGLGLRSMKERTSLSGGTFTLESKVGSGTMVRAAWG